MKIEKQINYIAIVLTGVFLFTLIYSLIGV